jgi:uncharacterized membrane protein YcfT
MDTLRGAAVVGVVALHAELVVAGLAGAPPLVHAVNELLGPVRMPLLVLLSGLLVPRSLAKGVATHLRGKVVHILWPYLVWGMLDVTHVLLDALALGRPLPWRLLGQLFHDPHTYLWFLAYLFVYHVAVGVLPAWARTCAIPLAFWAAGTVPDGTSLDRLLTLFGWFLLGDLAARWLTGRVPVPLVRASRRLYVAPLAAVGRGSLVHYSCHLLVQVYAIPRLFGWGVTDPSALWVCGVGSALGVGLVLDRFRHRRGVSWLFAMPRPAVAAHPDEKRVPART